MWLEILSNRVAFKKISKYLGISQSVSLELSLMLLANFINNGINFVANIIIARKFGYEVFGLFSIAVNIALTTLTFSEFGMNLTMVRLYKLHAEDSHKSQAVLLWNFYFKCVVFAIILLIAAIFSKSFSIMQIRSPGKSALIAFALITGGILGFWSYLKAFFQSLNLLKNIAYMTFLYAILRLVFLIYFVIFSLSVNAEVIFLGTYFIPVILSLAFATYKHLRRLDFKGVNKKELTHIGKEVINYSKWVAISSVFFALIQRSMVFIAALHSDIKKVSLLSAGLVFTMVFSLINDSARQVLFPKIAQLSLSGIISYKKKIFKIMPIYFLFSALLIATLSVFMVFSLGGKYHESLFIFWISGSGVALATGIGFYTMLVHTLQKPYIDAYINIGRLILMVFLGSILAKAYSIIGIVFAYAITIVFGEVLMGVLISRYIKRENHL